jgi:hypothetical protein
MATEKGSTGMKARVIVLAAMVVIGAGAAMATSALSGSGRPTQPPAARDPSVPRTDADLGKGERLLLVVGGAFATREEAEQANEGILVGDLQGFYVAATEQFPGLEDVLGRDDAEYVLVSAFRTSRGAREFLELVQSFGYSAFVSPRLENRGSEYVGLGQEEDPDGSGPLTEPIPGVTS